MAKNFYDITLALAGVCQSAFLVQQLAHQGNCAPEVLHATLASVVDLNPKSTLAVFGGDEQLLRPGLETLMAVLNNRRSDSSAEFTRYTLSLIVLERKLHSNQNTLNELATRIGALERQLAHYPLESETLQSAMAAIYVDLISPLGPRIQVTGSPAVLQNNLIQSRVRAVLLAGIRAAVLWQQVGGSRLQLMFSRQRLIKEAKLILSRLPETTHNLSQ
ncbi:MAG: High frequency lysogenization protein HflD [Candidatus Erwinia impunctatus]